VHSGTTNLFHPLLFEPHYWQERLARLDGRARRMLIAPRPELAAEVAGLEVVELLLRSHDDLRLKGIVARFPITGPPSRVLLRWPDAASLDRLPFEEVDPGAAHLYLFRDPDRRLEDRVLDFVCLLCAAKGLPALEGTRPTIELAEGQRAPDEYRIGRALLDRGWCEAIEVEREFERHKGSA
jgi:hypothetical protein